jgi:putative ABC transport system permease protein
LSAVVLWQAVLLGGLGYLPGLAAAAGLYEVARHAAGMPMALTLPAAAGVLALAVGMCVASGLLGIRKVHTADPANLF